MDRIQEAIDRLETEGALPKLERTSLEDECTHILSERLNDQAPLYEESYRPHARRLIEVIAAAERRRVRAELLEWAENQPSYAAEWVHRGDLRAALDRIIPQED